MASSLSDAIEFQGECYRTIGCGADLSAELPPQKAEGMNAMRYRCPHCGVTAQLERRTKVEDPTP